MAQDANNPIEGSTYKGNPTEKMPELSKKVTQLGRDIMAGKYKGSADLSKVILEQFTPEEMSHIVINYVMSEIDKQMQDNPMAALAAMLKGLKRD